MPSITPTTTEIDQTRLYSHALVNLLRYINVDYSFF